MVDRHDAASPIVARIRKLIALAERTPNAAEAETCFAKAQKLLLEHGLSQDDLRHADGPEVIQQNAWTGKRIGKELWSAAICCQELCFVVATKGRTFDRQEFDRAWDLFWLQKKSQLASAVTPPKFAGRGRRVMFCGRAENVAVAIYSLQVIARQLRQKVRNAKPTCIESFLRGAEAGFLERLRESRRPLGSRSESTAISTLPARLIKEAADWLSRNANVVPAKVVSASEASSAMTGFRAGREIEVDSPLPGSANSAGRLACPTRRLSYVGEFAVR
jgi:hypothetical protein